MSPGGAVQRGGGVRRSGGLPVDVAAGRFPGFEGRVGDERVRGGLGEARVLQVVGWDGDGQRGVEVAVPRQRLVDVGLLLGLRGLEGRRRYGLVTGEVHDRKALIVATGSGFCCRGKHKKYFTFRSTPH